MGHMRERSNMVGYRTIRDSGSITSVLSLMLRDGLLFYAMIFVTIFVTGMLFWVGTHALAGIPWLVACYSVSGSRLVLTLHGNPKDAMGIYEQGTELLVQQPRRLTNAFEEGALHTGTAPTGE
ncbi:hypothetical protein JB92DRAFT_144604 [Gautieria morchelliformis]|nr:hypothetical protein JB92DRAFT_144604 [Gautieria morchelliformis]